MNIRDFSNDFLISIFSQDADLATGLKLVLTDESVHAKYNTFYFSDHSELLNQSVVSPSHILIIDVETLIIPIHEFIEKVLKASTEVQFIFLTAAQNAASFKKYQKYNLNFVFDRKSELIFEHVLAAVDLISEKLYRTYQNEQVFTAYQNEKDLHLNLLEKNKTESESAVVRPYQNRISIYKLAESKEQLLDQFYQATPMQSWLYLKMIPTIQTLICVSSANAPESWTEGLSYKIPQKDKSFSENLLMGQMPDHLCSYLKNKFGIDRIKFLPLVIKQSIEGLLISSQDIDAAVAEDFSLMSLIYAQLVYESQPKFLDVEDSLTGFYNELFYKRILDKEIDRSKRTFSPLSVVKIKIDKLLEIETSHGRATVDEIIKKVAEQIKATSRLPDYICRTAENEFSLVLTNCHRKGAALRAERLRQSLETEKFIKSGLQITVSQGISEYPTLTGSIEDLNQSATSAMKFISEKGGNKICIYKAQAHHQPDFTVSV
jgi:diguanylate cyclase (GGDEF)-like protein